MAFGDIVRSKSTDDIQGIGGDSSTIWGGYSSQSDYLKEFSTADLSEIKSTSPTISGQVNGIGGSTDVIWYVNQEKVFAELSTSDFSVVRETTTSNEYEGVGGSTDVIWTKDSDEMVNEHSPSDFSVLRSNTLNWQPDDFNDTGIGGNKDNIWTCGYQGRLGEVSTGDLSLIEESSAVDSSGVGIGGDGDTVWHSSDSYIYELEPTLDPPNAPSNLTTTIK